MLEPAAHFLTLEQVAEELATSVAQIRALVRRRELEAIQIGGRRQYRVERAKLEDYIARAYAETAAWLEKNPPPAEDAGNPS